MTPVLCPACGLDVAIPSDPMLGELLFCDACGAEIEVISLEPVRVSLYEEEEK